MMRLRRIDLLAGRPWPLLFLAWLCWPAAARQQAYLLQHQHWGEEAGLPSPTVLAKLYLPDGYIWVGTPKGLARLDGYQFKTYTQEHGLLSSQVSHLASDGAGRIWVGHTNDAFGAGALSGLSVLDTKKEEILPFERAIAEAFPGELHALAWMGSARNGTIYFYDIQGYLYTYRIEAGFRKSASPVFSHAPETITFAQNGEVWAIAQKGEAIVLGEDATVAYRMAVPPQTERVLDCLGDWVWLELFDELDSRAARYNRGSGELQLLGKPDNGRAGRLLCAFPQSGQIWYLSPDEQMNVVVGLEGNILWEGPTEVVGEWPFTVPEKQLIWSMARSAWQATSLVASPFMAGFSQPTAGKSCSIRTMLEIPGRPGRVLVTGMRLLHEFDLASGQDANRLAAYGEYPHLEYGYGLSVLPDTGDVIWITTEKDLLLRVSKPFAASPGLEAFQLGEKRDYASRHVQYFPWTLQHYGRGTLLVGTRQGLMLFDKQARQVSDFHAYNQYPELAQYEVMQILPYGPDTWLLATSGGIYRLERERGVVARYHEQGEGRFRIPYNRVAHIMPLDGRWWLSTKGGGLVEFFPETGQANQYTKTEGLSDNTVYAALPDRAGALWLSGDKGLMRFDMATRVAVHYQEQDGLPHREFNTLSYLATASGHLVFGGLNGVVAFHPDSLRALQRVPRVIMSECLRQRREDGRWMQALSDFQQDGEIVLRPEDFGFVARFSMLDYLNGPDARYQYRIEGLGDGWTLLNEPELRVHALPYGNYELEVMVRPSHGLPPGYLRIPIRSVAPFYLSYWFIGSAIISLAGGVWFWMRYRIRSLRLRQLMLERQILARTQEIRRDKAVIEAQSRQLRQADEIKSRFFANISHELRTPVTLILGPVRQLLESSVQLPSLAQAQLEVVERNGSYLLRLVSELLDLSKLEAGKAVAQPKPTDLWSYLREIASLFQPAAIRNGIEFSIRFYPEHPVWVLVDRELLRKVAYNLLSNALKFTPKDGKVGFSVRAVSKDDSWALAIEVADTGKGIHPQDLPHIFERYYQTSVPGAQAEGGTGIGLALAKELVDLMGGRLEVSSALGQGSLFTLSMLVPAVTQEAAVMGNADMPKPAAIPQAAISVPQSLVLLVEDHPDMRAYISSILEKLGRVVCCGNGVEALAWLEQAQQLPQLLVSDVMMPEMDGFMLAERLRAHPRFSEVPVMLLTARAEQQDRLRAFTLGVSDYLTKPFAESELLAVARQLLLRGSEAKEAAGEEGPDEALMSHAEWLAEIQGHALAALAKGWLTVGYVADQMGMSERQLQRRLKTATGLSPKAYLQEIQMQYAREQLEEGKVDQVGKLAASIGFKNAHYFSQKYEERFGKRPIDYLQA